MGYPVRGDRGPYLIEVFGNLYGTQKAGRIFCLQMDTCTFIQGFSNKTGAATLSLQPRFHQQDGGSHAFLSAKVSSTRRGQPRFHCSQSFINKTGAASLSLQPKFYQQVHTNKYTFPHGGPVHFLPLLG